MPKKIPIAFHNGYNYDCQLITKELAEEFKKQFTYSLIYLQEHCKNQENWRRGYKKCILHITIYW